MDSIFSIGIQSLWDELRHMPVGGVWWVNTDRNEDAISLVNQTIAAQGKDSRVAIITMGEEPKSIIRLDSDRGPQTVRLFSMPAEIYTDVVLKSKRQNALMKLQPKTSNNDKLFHF